MRRILMLAVLSAAAICNLDFCAAAPGDQLCVVTEEYQPTAGVTVSTLEDTLVRIEGRLDKLESRCQCVAVSHQASVGVSATEPEAAPDCADCLIQGVDSSGKRWGSIWTRTQYHDPATGQWVSGPAQLEAAAPSGATACSGGNCSSGACSQSGGGCGAGNCGQSQGRGFLGRRR